MNRQTSRGHDDGLEEGAGEINRETESEERSLLDKLQTDISCYLPDNKEKQSDLNTESKTHTTQR